MAFEFTDVNFEKSAIANSGITVIDFWAEWCGPCRMVGPVVEELANDYKDQAQILIGKVDVDSNPEVAMKYGIRSIPTILFLKNGELVDKHVGATTKKVLNDKIQSLMQ